MTAREAFMLHRPELRRLAREGCAVAVAELARRDARRAVKRDARLTTSERAHYRETSERDAVCPSCAVPSGVTEDHDGVLHAAYCAACATADVCELAA